MYIFPESKAWHFIQNVSLEWTIKSYYKGKLRRMDILGKHSTIFDKGDNFDDFLRALLYIDLLIKKGLL